MDWSRIVDGYCERVGITCESTDNEYVEFLTGYYPGYGASVRREGVAAPLWRGARTERR